MNNSQDLLAGAKVLIAKGRSVFLIAGNKMPYANCDECRGETTPAHRAVCKCLKTGGLCHGFYAATDDLDQVSKWLEEHPECTLLGVPTGSSTGIFVMEYDPKNGGEGSYKTLVKEHGEIETEINRSPSTGLHLVFKMPDFEFQSIHNKLWPGIDIKAGGGYHIVPPSHYTDAEGVRKAYTAVNTMEPQTAPQWLLDKIWDYQTSKKWDPTSRLLSQNQRQEYNPANLTQGQIELVEKTVDYWTDRVRSAKDGDQNNLIYTASRVLFSLVFHGVLDEEDAHVHLEDACEEGNHPQSRSLKSIDSGMRAALADPDPLDDALSDDRSIVAAFTQDDFGNADRVIFHAGHILRYDPDREQFLMWNSTRWLPATKSRVSGVVEDVLKNIAKTEGPFYSADSYPASEKGKKDKKTHREAFVSWAQKQRSTYAVNQTVQRLPGREALYCSVDEFDKDPYQINTPTGVVNLTTGELLPHDSSYLCTEITGAAYNPDATCAEWERFLEFVMPDPEHRAYLKRLAGMSAIGEVREQVFILNKGAGGAGQGVFLQVLHAVLGTYVTKGATRVFQAGSGTTARFDAANWTGNRIVYFDELGEHKLNEEALKEHTGGDEIHTERKGETGFDFTPKYTIWIRTNHIPQMRNDNSMKRRFLLVNWDVIVPGMVWDSFRSMDHARVDQYFYNQEASGILNWVLEGTRDYLMHGLKVPADLEAAATASLEENDAEAGFMSACVEIDQDNEDATALISDVYGAYKTYVEEEFGRNSDQLKGQRAFNKMLAEKYKLKRTGSDYHKPAKWFGVRLKTNILRVR
ncbi:phage/plasmid primase, P4 family [Streptomyces olivochromogenes]|uniref:ATP-binding protein n=1 Tax=Streptomyces olivochromogenes TaxID=1963 RepID=A0A250VKI8_STROL|nr:phage/plasmid primase, P4 family [Streptomyces olivochromogenes]GAX54733.1 ATP-binding protein [Streptomyces olivochromogenes]